MEIEDRESIGIRKKKTNEGSSSINITLDE